MQRPFLCELLLDAVVTTVSSGDGIRTAHYNNFSFGALLGGAIASGSIVGTLQYHDRLGWHTFYDFTIDADTDVTDGSVFPVFVSQKAYDRVRALVTTHDAVESDSDAVSLSIAISGGQ